MSTRINDPHFSAVTLCVVCGKSDGDFYHDYHKFRPRHTLATRLHLVSPHGMSGLSYALLFIAALCTLLGIISVSVVETTRAQCARVQANTGIDTKFVGGTYFTRECYVHVNGEWVPYDKWVNNSGN